MSNISFRALSGAHNEGPLCYLLKIDDYQILLDCGWDDHFNVKDKHIQELKKLAPEIDAVLLSHSDLQHVGALPYLFGKLGCKAQIFASLPVSKMGLMFMYDLYQSRRNEEDFDVFDLDDVDTAFDKVRPLKYSQRVRTQDASGKGGGITIAPFAAGHTLGGTIWKISKETDEIIYAVDLNLKTERHLNGAALDSLGKPSILITDAYTSMNKNPEKKTDGQIVELVTKTLRGNGNVLIPCDSAGRVFEMMVLLEQHWKANRGMSAYGMVFLSNVSYRTIQFASHQLEWMSENVKKGFDERRENPFNFKFIKLCHSLEDIAKQEVASPMVVFATSNSLETGFARDLFIKWAQQPSNLVLLTDRSFPHCLSRLLADRLIASAKLPSPIKLVYKRRVELTGEKLKKYEQKMKALKEAEKKRKREEEQRKKVIQIRDEEDEDDEELDKIERMVNTTSKTQASSHPRLYLPENMIYHSQYLMFPCIEQTFEYNEYGQKIDMEELRNRSLQLYEDSGNDMDVDEGPARQNQEEEEKAEKPTECIRSEEEIYLSCNIQFVDFEGRSNGASIRNALQKVNARKVVIIHGAKDATESLKQFCEDKKMNVVAPKLFEGVDLTMETNMFKVKLREDLWNQLQFVKCGNYDLGFVEGEYRFDEDIAMGTTASQENQAVTPSSTTPVAKMPYLGILSTKENKGHNSLFIGDVKLGQFRDVLSRNGFNVALQKGILVCNDKVMLRKDQQSGEILVEGAMSVDYLRIKALLFNQYQVL